MTKRLNKQELIDAVKTQVAEKRPGLTKADVEAVLDALGETLRNELAEGNIVPITGFGIFELKETFSAFAVAVFFSWMNAFAASMDSSMRSKVQSA